MSRILVMGGTEFVSGTLAMKLISKGYKVDILTRGTRNPDYEGIHHHHVCDRKNEKALQDQLGDVEYDYVFDVTAYTKEDVRLLTSVLNQNALKRYVFCSSGAVYPSSQTYVMEGSETGSNPHWGQYGSDKFEAENLLVEMYKKEAVPSVIFRPPYIYGEGNNIYREAFLFERIQNNQPVPYPGDGSTKVHFIHIEDLVETFASTITVDKSVGQTYNVAYPEDVSWPDYLTTAMEVVGRKVPLVQVDEKTSESLNLTFRDYFPFRDETFLMSIEKLRQSGLHVPEINLKKGLERTYEWYTATETKPNYRKMPNIDYAVNQILKVQR